jgi:zinc transport system substrate-binding protein
MWHYLARTPKHMLILLIGSLVGCNHASSTPPAGTTSTPPANAQPGDRPVIVASIFPLQNLIAQLTGDWAQVDLLMPPGSSPHDFEPVAAQMAPLSRADMLIVVGLNLDGWAEKAAKNVAQPGLAIERMADLVGSGEASNQHLWMDPALTARFVKALLPILGNKYPQHRDEIERRGKALLADLTTMDNDFRRELSAVPEKRLISYHNAYDLLAARYGLQVVAHLTEIELAPGGEVTPKDLVATIEAIQKYHLRVIYAEPQFPERAMQAIHEQTGVKVLSLDDLGGPSRPGYDSYQALMRSDVKTLVEGQSEKL